MGLFISSSLRRHSFLRLPSSSIDEDVPFIESSQAVDVHRFERKLNFLILTTGVLSTAVIALVVVAITMSRTTWPNLSAIKHADLQNETIRWHS